MLSTVSTKGQVTIPMDIRSLFHIRPNDRVDFIVEGERIFLMPVKTLKDLRGVVQAKSWSDSSEERDVAKAAVGRRVKAEMS
ncbi:MAG: AbrB/MazE/SpoVT family DNA-binding domain-containing protein [Deltaproteobacteria bacterium]|jgi:AbrB family looped-hinge helix DNA binding protein|nr:AbrB/MazE/SpoVT family DNA-binding domain-containing protein [Deltaproteobacteria bacterium]